MNNTGNYNECQDVQCTNYGPIAYWIGLDWLLEVTRDGIYLFRYVFRYLFRYVFITYLESATATIVKPFTVNCEGVKIFANDAVNWWFKYCDTTPNSLPVHLQGTCEGGCK